MTSSCIAAYISLVALLRGALAIGLQTTQIRHDQIAVNYVCGRFSNECTLRQVVDVSLGIILFDPLLMLRLTAVERRTVVVSPVQVMSVKGGTC